MSQPTAARRATTRRGHPVLARSPMDPAARTRIVAAAGHDAGPDVVAIVDGNRTSVWTTYTQPHVHFELSTTAAGGRLWRSLRTHHRDVTEHELEPGDIVDLLVAGGPAAVRLAHDLTTRQDDPLPLSQALVAAHAAFSPAGGHCGATPVRHRHC